MKNIDCQKTISHLPSTITMKKTVTIPTNLFCLSASKKYLNTNIKVMFFGQETNDWEGNFENSYDLNHLLKTYDNFFNNGNYFKYIGQFWNGIFKLKLKLKEHYFNSRKKVGLLRRVL